MYLDRSIDGHSKFHSPNSLPGYNANYLYSRVLVMLNHLCVCIDFIVLEPFPTPDPVKVSITASDIQLIDFNTRPGFWSTSLLFRYLYKHDIIDFTINFSNGII